jgi:uncharacterized protein (TIGR02001 family)
MKKTLSLCAALLAGGIALHAADEYTYSVTADFPYVTQYVFRGVKIAKSSVQPSVELAVENFYAGIWNNTPLTSMHDGNISKEIDLYAGYTPKITDKLKADIGATSYRYPWADDGFSKQSFEVYLGLNATLGNFTPSIYVNRDLDLRVTTVQTSVGYSLPLTDLGTSLDFTATAGIVSLDDSEASLTGYRYYSIGVNVPYKLSDVVKVNAGVNYTFNDINGASDPGLWGTIGVSAQF